ncbi:hypothetical protein [Niveibacterium sp. SC-1]|uniref:hypothetical protein n=1 Tax=Niveibacterium sp. SC-1 TaxID=3135646 RepID=UPI00311F4172
MLTAIPTAWASSAKVLVYVLGLALLFGAGFATGKRWEHGTNAIDAQQQLAKAEEGRARIAAQDRAALEQSAVVRTKAEARARDLSLRIADASQKPPPADCRLSAADRGLLNGAIDTANGEDTAGSLLPGLSETAHARK